MRKFLDRNDPFFAQKWRRWVTVAVPALWGCAELYLGNPGWAVAFIALGAFAAYELFLRPDP